MFAFKILSSVSSISNHFPFFICYVRLHFPLIFHEGKKFNKLFKNKISFFIKAITSPVISGTKCPYRWTGEFDIKYQRIVGQIDGYRLRFTKFILFLMDFKIESSLACKNYLTSNIQSWLIMFIDEVIDQL